MTRLGAPDLPVGGRAARRPRASEASVKNPSVKNPLVELAQAELGEWNAVQAAIRCAR